MSSESTMTTDEKLFEARTKIASLMYVIAFLERSRTELEATIATIVPINYNNNG